MSSQLKFLFALCGLVILFLFLQEKFGKEIVSIEETEEDKVVEEIDKEKKVDTNEQDFVEIHIPSGNVIKVNVEVAGTDVERMNGLSKREFLGDYNGMWFVYTEDIQNPFWMPDMNFPLDIIFVDSKGFIVDIIENAQACVTIENCPNLYPKTEYRFVLEVNAGFCKLHEIEEGYSITQYF